MTPTFSLTNIKSSLSLRLSGEIVDASLSLIANDAVLSVIADIDLVSTIRKTAMSPNLMDGQYDYSAPSDLKGEKIIDVKSQTTRGRFDDWRLTAPEEFDRLKLNDEDVLIPGQYSNYPINGEYEGWGGDAIVAIDTRDFIKKIRISRSFDNSQITIDAMNVIGDWAGYGDGTNATTDTLDYVKGSGSINWDINADGGTTAGIYNDSIDTFDVSDYKSTGSLFVWSYITSTTNLTNFKIRIGSGASAYYEITETTNNEGNSFFNGWNLLRFDFADKTTTGTPDDDGCTYVALFMTKDGAKVSETDYRFDNLVMANGKHYDTYYYSKYGWQTSAGVYIEESTDDTDLINADTEEYKIYLEKGLELGEEQLRNYTQRDSHRKRYDEMIAKYKLEYPSRALINQTTIYNF